MMNEWERLSRQAQRYKESYPPGTRIMLISMEDPWAPVPSGMRGTVEVVDDIGQIHMILSQSQLIRRLLPVECERLQGYPDGWTDIPGASDSSRYKALGNSVATTTSMRDRERSPSSSRCSTHSRMKTITMKGFSRKASSPRAKSDRKEGKIEGVLSDEHLPDWARAKVEAIRADSEEIESASMEMGGIT